MTHLRFVAVALVLLLGLAACAGPGARRDEFYDHARELFEQERLDEAKVQVRNALKVDPKFAPGYVLLGQINSDLELWRDAMNNYTRALEENPQILEALVGQARIYLLSGNVDRAREQAAKAFELAPQDADAMLVRAAVEARDGRRGEAAVMVDELLAAHPDHVEAHAFKSLLAFQQGDPDGAIAALEHALTQVSETTALKKQLAGMYVQAGRTDDADRTYAELLRTERDDLELERMALGYYIGSEQPGKARDLAARLVREHPDEENYVLLQADVLGRLGDMKGKEQVLRDAVRKLSPGYGPRLALIETLVRLGRLPDAETLARETAEIEPSNQNALAARRALADILVRQVRYDDAEAELERIFELSPGDMEAQVFMGRVALAKGDPLRAITLFRQVIDQQPDLLPVYGYLSQAHYVNGEVELAKDALAQALEVDPEFENARRALMNLYLADGQHSRAIALLRDAAREQPDNPSLVVSMGDVHLMQDDYGQAAQRYRQAMRMERGAVLGLFKLGQMELRRKNFDKALEYFGQLHAGAPGLFQASEAIVGVLLLQKKYDQAEEFARSLMKDGENPAGYDLLGRVEATRGNLDQAEEYFFKAKELEPRWRDPYQVIGTIYLKQGKQDEAIAKFRAALENSPEVIGNAYVLGMLHQQRGETAKAEEMYEYVLERNPDFVPAQNNLAYLYAETATDQATLDRALDLALRASANSSAATLDTLGWVYHKSGNHQLALSTLMRAMELRGDDPAILLHLATVQAELGAVEQARSLAERVAAWDEDVPERDKAAKLLERL